MAARKSKQQIDKKAIIAAFAEMAKERNIDTDILQGIIEETLSIMVKKKYGSGSEFEIIVNMKKGDIEIYLIKEVVEEVENTETEITLQEANMYSTEPLEIGDDFIEEITLENIADSFGRRLIMTTAQTMNQRIHDVERDTIFNEYKDKVGEIIIGEVFQLIRKTNMFSIMHNGTEMKLLRDDQMPTDVRFLKKNKPVKAVIKSVTRKQGGVPEILLSRRSDEFVKGLFSIEIPEINDGIVQIKAVASEPGERMKVAVASVIDRVDPVGTCVGLKGIRISSIIQELGGTRVDLIAWSDDPATLIEKSIAPAYIRSVKVQPETKSATVVIDEEQIKIAVGHNGQNIRLASKLTGYDIKLINESNEDIDIKEFEEEIGATFLQNLINSEITTARDFLETPPAVLLNECNMDYDSIVDIRQVILSEFEENESEDYLSALKIIAGKSSTEDTENMEDTNIEEESITSMEESMTKTIEEN